MKFGTGPARAITKYDFAEAADALKVHPANLEAIALAESAGFGWYRDGRMKILPEPHKFYAYLPKSKRDKAIRLGLATRNYEATKASGHYGRMGGATKRYVFFEKMIEFGPVAAFKAVSYGTYQIMGFNHKHCGYASAAIMMDRFLQGEAEQLTAFVKFLKYRRLVRAIRDANYKLVETRYNGGGQGGAYAKIMHGHRRRLLKGKWKNYTPGSIPKPVAKPTKSTPEIPGAVKHAPAAITGLAVSAAAGAGLFWGKIETFFNWLWPF